MTVFSVYYPLLALSKILPHQNPLKISRHTLTPSLPTLFSLSLPTPPDPRSGDRTDCPNRMGNFSYQLKTYP